MRFLTPPLSFTTIHHPRDMPSSSSSSSSWIVGIFVQRTKRAVLEPYDSEPVARAAYDAHPHASRILLRRRRRTNDGQGSATTTENSNKAHNENDTDKLVCCSTAPWDTQGLGVATLLQGGTASPEEIQQQLTAGTLPFVPPQRSAHTQNWCKIAMKLFFGRTAVTHFGSAPYRYASVCHFDVPEVVPQQQQPAGGSTDDSNHNTPSLKYVALSLDDAPCRFRSREYSLVARIQDLLDQYHAKATFMLVGRWCTAQHEPDLVSLLQDGHELANHGMDDRSYEHDNPDDFGKAVDECTDMIQTLQHKAGVPVTTPWFRAPHGRYTVAMAQQLQQRNMVNVMCDTYASCPIVQDGDFVAQQLLQTVQHGSIILLHMPEVHVRQWCWTALEKLLAGLQQQGYRVVTVGELARLSGSNGPCANETDTQSTKQQG